MHSAPSSPPQNTEGSMVDAELDTDKCAIAGSVGCCDDAHAAQPSHQEVSALVQHDEEGQA